MLKNSKAKADFLKARIRDGINEMLGAQSHFAIIIYT